MWAWYLAPQDQHQNTPKPLCDPAGIIMFFFNDTYRRTPFQARRSASQPRELHAHFAHNIGMHSVACPPTLPSLTVRGSSLL